MKKTEAASAVLSDFYCGLAYRDIGHSWKHKKIFSVVQ